jgi:large subunit ribosomal protein L24
LKPKNNNGNGEIVEVEMPIHRSNVMLVDPKTKKPTRIKFDFDKEGKKIRISKKSNEKID